jgi:hypothetical protein
MLIYSILLLKRSEKMTIESQIAICSENYQRWKQVALGGDAKAMERAFFWLELQTAFITLHAIEQTHQDRESKQKLISAKANLSKKLADYADEILSEIGG